MPAIVEWLQWHFLTYEIWHPFKGNGYQLWSGVGLSGAVVVWWRKHNCHHHRCPFLTWQASEAHDGHEVCRLHHPQHHGLLSRLFAALNRLPRVNLHHGGSDSSVHLKGHTARHGPSDLAS